MACAPQRRLRSVWACIQSDQSLLCAHLVAKDPSVFHLRWAHMLFCWFCHALAQMKGSNTAHIPCQYSVELCFPRRILCFSCSLSICRWFHYVAFVLSKVVPHLSFCWCLRKAELRDVGISLVSSLIFSQTIYEPNRPNGPENSITSHLFVKETDNPSLFVDFRCL